MEYRLLIMVWFLQHHACIRHNDDQPRTTERSYRDIAIRSSGDRCAARLLRFGRTSPFLVFRELGAVIRGAVAFVPDRARLKRLSSVQNSEETHNIKRVEIRGDFAR